MLRAAQLAADASRSVLLLVPWVGAEQQPLIYPAGLTFSSHQEQAEYILTGECVVWAECVAVATQKQARLSSSSSNSSNSSSRSKLSTHRRVSVLVNVLSGSTQAD
jgi:hypothetical protein